MYTIITLGISNDKLIALKEKMYILGFWDTSEFTPVADGTFMYWFEALKKSYGTSGHTSIHDLSNLLDEAFEPMLGITGAPAYKPQGLGVPASGLFLPKNGVTPGTKPPAAYTVNRAYLVPKEVSKKPSIVYGSVDKIELVKVRSPILLTIAWNTNLHARTLTVNKIVAEAIIASLNELNGMFSQQELDDSGIKLYGGCYNKRRVRGGTTWSSHSWGTSFDFNPLGNRMGAEPTTTKFFTCPVHTKFAEILYKNGFRTLSHDLMHWQYVPMNYR